MKQELNKRRKPVKKMTPVERLPSRTQKANPSGNMADKALGNLMNGNVLPSSGRNAEAPSISRINNRRNK